MSIQMSLLKSIMDSRRSNFNLTQEQFAKLYEEQNGVAAVLVLDVVKKAESDDFPMLDDELLYRFGEYYSSEYVATNKPWIRAKPFSEWLQGELMFGGQMHVGQL